MKPLVLYHGPPCFDGFCSVWVARRALGAIDAVPVQYGQPPPIDCCGRDVYILDFSYPRDVMRGIIGQSRRVVVLDHHKTAQAELAGLADEYAERGDSPLPLIRFDMYKSGGRLTWEYFFPSQPAPWLVEFTEDRDLWRHAIPHSREINAWLRSWPMDFDLWDKFNLSGPWDTRIEAGAAILRAERQIIDQHVRHAREFEIDGHIVRAVNATVLISEIAGELAVGRPFGACWFDAIHDGRTKRVWSLRSTEAGEDVSAIAKKRGGGGHRNAAGFEEVVTR